MLGIILSALILAMPLAFAAWFAVTEWRDRRFRREYAAFKLRQRAARASWEARQ